jgi:hypothetical protein
LKKLADKGDRPLANYVANYCARTSSTRSEGKPMADEFPDNVDLQWLGQNLLDMRTEMREGIADLKRMRAADRSLLEAVAHEVGLEPGTAQLKREKFETEIVKRLERLEEKVFPPAK